MSSPAQEAVLCLLNHGFHLMERVNKNKTNSWWKWKQKKKMGWIINVLWCKETTLVLQRESFHGLVSVATATPPTREKQEDSMCRVRSIWTLTNMDDINPTSVCMNTLQTHSLSNSAAPSESKSCCWSFYNSGFWNNPDPVRSFTAHQLQYLSYLGQTDIYLSDKYDKCQETKTSQSS